MKLVPREYVKSNLSGSGEIGDESANYVDSNLKASGEVALEKSRWWSSRYVNHDVLEKMGLRSFWAGELSIVLNFWC